MDNQEKLKKALEVLRLISRVGDRLSNLPCRSSVYELDDDDFGDIMFIRDIADESLKVLDE